MLALSLPAAILSLASVALPAPAPLTAVAPAGTEILRDRDGLFYVTAMVNGAPVRFVVDTGATIVVLTPADARRVGLALGPSAFTARAGTAGGKAAMARVRLDEVVVGSTRRHAIEAAVVGKDLQVSLLGQSLLSRLDSVTIQADRMVLN